MQRTTVEPRTVVYEIVCDRCAKDARRDDNDFGLMTSIGFNAGHDSILGDGSRVEIDLCEPCLRETLGTWLRVKTPADTLLARMLDKFKPGVHGGQFPGATDDDREDLADKARVAADRVGAAPSTMHSPRFRRVRRASRPRNRSRVLRVVDARLRALSIRGLKVRSIRERAHWQLWLDWLEPSQ